MHALRVDVVICRIGAIWVWSWMLYIVPITAGLRSILKLITFFKWTHRSTSSSSLRHCHSYVIVAYSHKFQDRWYINSHSRHPSWHPNMLPQLHPRLGRSMFLQSYPQAWPTSSCELLANQDWLWLAATKQFSVKVQEHSQIGYKWKCFFSHLY